MPLRSSRESVLPKPAAKRNAPIRSAITSRSSRPSRTIPVELGESSVVACSIAAAWVKCTT